MLSGDKSAVSAQGFIHTDVLYKRQLYKAKEFKQLIIRKGHLHCTNHFYIKVKCVKGQMVLAAQISSLYPKEDH